MIMESNADDDCSDFLQYTVNDKGETQGMITLKPKNVQEHKLRVHLMVKGQITTVSLHDVECLQSEID